jgi:hypothetical protein
MHCHMYVKYLLFLHVAWISWRYLCNMWQTIHFVTDRHVGSWYWLYSYIAEYGIVMRCVYKCVDVGEYKGGMVNKIPTFGRVLYKPKWGATGNTAPDWNC